MFELNLSVLVAFFAGILSFLSPCILPILPSFLGYIGGISLNPISLRLHPRKLRRKLIVNSLLFSLGFLVVFLVVGASIGFLGELFFKTQPVFQQVAGVIILILGFHMLGLLQLSFLQREIKIRIPHWIDHLEHFRSFFVGILFSFGWAPCYGPITGSILTLVAVKGTALTGLWYFGWYSLGFILPFLIISFFVVETIHWIKGYHRILRALNLVAGGVIVLLGLLLLTNNFDLLVNWLSTHYNDSAFWRFN